MYCQRDDKPGSMRASTGATADRRSLNDGQCYVEAEITKRPLLTRGETAIRRPSRRNWRDRFTLSALVAKFASRARKTALQSPVVTARIAPAALDGQ